MNDFTIVDFPSGDDYWLLTWIGATSIVENDYRIDLDFVSIDQDAYKKNPIYLNYILKEGVQVRRAPIKPVGIDFLIAAEIGSVWHQQKLVSSPADLDKIPHLNVRIKKAEYAKLSTISQEIEIPHKYHSFSPGRKHHLSPCLVITSDNFTAFYSTYKIEKVIICPTELIRFYFCGSGFFAKQLLANGIPDDRVFIQSLTRFNEETGEAYIRMRKEMVESDARYVARMAINKTAYQSAIDIGRSVQRAYLNGQKPFIEAIFPFNGPTTLSLVGKYVRLSEKPERWGFLVYTIKFCTAPLPFTKVWYERDSDNTQTPNPLQEKIANTPSIRVPSNPQPNSLITSIGAPNNQMAKVPILYSFESKFSHHPEAERVKKEQQQVRTIGRRPTWLTQTNTYSTSENQAEENGIAPASLQTTEEEQIVDYTALNTIIEELRKVNVLCSYLHRPSNWQELFTISDFGFPSYDPGNKSMSNWRSIKMDSHEGNKNKRLRRIAVVRMVRGGTGYYLIECEARPSENFSRVIISQPGQLSLPSTLLDSVLRLLARNKGIWSNCDLTLLNVVKQPFYHLKNDTSVAVATRLLRYMDRIRK